MYMWERGTPIVCEACGINWEGIRAETVVSYNSHMRTGWHRKLGPQKKKKSHACIRELQEGDEPTWTCALCRPKKVGLLHYHPEDKKGRLLIAKHNKVKHHYVTLEENIPRAVWERLHAHRQTEGAFCRTLNVKGTAP